MKKTHIFIFAIALTICFIATAGCTNASNTPAQSQVQPTNKYPTVSFNATPVKYVQVNGVTLGYREFGSGEPVLMLAGFGETMDSWNQTFIGILATKYHVYTFDPRGMGTSSDNNGTHTIALYADDAAGIMPALGYNSMHVYGVSMGSSISQQLVIDHPDRVQKLVLDSVSYSVRIPETKTLLGILESVAAPNSTYPLGVQHEAEADLAWKGSWDKLSGIQKDVMLVEGTADVITPDAVAAQMVTQINGSWLVRFKGLPHIGSQKAPVEYGENALSFFSNNESPPYATV
ncbi:MAG: alpha/beta hydrolase [Methanoregula sp.]|nr:alpha/beta hydrolase [Methanoregula sp.]